MLHVLILHAELPGELPDGVEAALLARLPYGRRIELERRDAADRVASLAGIALVLAGAGRMRGQWVDPAQLRFAQGRGPTLEGGPRFSVSHSRRRVGVALCDGGSLGLDVEDVAASSHRAGPGLDALERWTAIEAALKACGAGLREADKVRLSEDRSIATFAGEAIHLRPLQLAAGCVACLATGSPVLELTVEETAIPWRIAAAGATD